MLFPTCIVLLLLQTRSVSAGEGPSEEIRYIFQNGTCVEEPLAPMSSTEIGFRLFFVIVLLSLSALFAGLTLGVLGLDTLSLEVIASSGPQPDKTYAQKIIPIRRSPNQLLCTLLIGNVMLNVLISLAMARLASGLYGFIISTVLIVFFGEIIPQSACSKYALYVGSKSVLIVRFFMMLLYVFAKPISLILDWAVGKDSGQIYDRNMMLKLISLHVEEHSAESGLKSEDYDLMAGVIDFDQKRVKDVMTPLEDVFMLEVSTTITADILSKVWEQGHSRVPVYEGERSNVVGIVFVKDLIFIDIEEKLNLSIIIRLSSQSRKLHHTFDDVLLKDLLRDFSSGHSHLAIVKEVRQSKPGVDPVYHTIGIVTLEDVIEELTHIEIKDEADREDEEAMEQTLSGDRVMTIAKFQNLAGGTTARLGEAQLRAVTGFLRESVEEFKHLEDMQMRAVVRAAMVVDVKPGYKLFTRGEPLRHFILIVSGKVTMTVGADCGYINAELPSWSVLGKRALASSNALADYSAVVSAPSRILVLTSEQFRIMSMKLPPNILNLLKKNESNTSV